MKPLCMGDSNLLIDIIRKAIGEPHVGAEIGVHRGATSALLLQAFPELMLYMIDEWKAYKKTHPYRLSGDGCSKFTQMAQDENHAAAYEATVFAGGRKKVWQCSSLWAAQNMRLQLRMHGFDALDFCFIDADHSYSAVKADIEAWYPLVREGGICAGHDWNHPKEKRNGQFGVTKAITEYAETHGLAVQVEGSVWWIRK